MSSTLELLRQVAKLYIATLQKLLACGTSIKPANSGEWTEEVLSEDT